MAQKPNLLLLSTSTIHGSTYLGYCEEAVRELFGETSHLIFIPYARPSGISHDEYTEMAERRFGEMGIKVTGIHKYSMPSRALNDGDGIFTGGGNTFLLLKQLYANKLVEPIKKRVAEGIPYMGSSAGTNVAGLSIGTTNDMPVVYPPSFKALGLVPFNINPHYLDPDPNSKHMGETRETRIKEFLKFNRQAVVGLREGSWLRRSGYDLTLGGTLKSRIFRMNMDPEEFAPDQDFSWLLKGSK